MDSNSRFTINTPNITHETIDGETVIINLHNGNYYSLDGVGSEIWCSLEKGFTLAEIVKLVDDRYQGPLITKDKAVSALLSELLTEKLVVSDNKKPAETDFAHEILSEDAKLTFVVPTLNKYSDMQDLLLLDPIHEVDDKTGWPERKV